ncbi:acid resistance putative oxidoreductase YdeP [Escherichia coli]
MGKTISIKVLFGIYLLLMAGKVFAFSCNVDGGSSIGAGTTSVYVNLDPVIQPGQNLVVDLSQHISCWNDYGGWYDTDHINLVQGSAFAGSLQSYKGSLYWNNVTYPFPLTTNTNVLDIGDKTPMPLPLKLYITPVGAAGGVVIKAGEVIARIHMYKIATLGSGNPRNFTWNIISNNNVVMPTGGCTVDSRNVTVDLPDFPGSAEIPLGVYCSSEQKLSFYLSGATTDSSRQVFANTAPDATKASGVGVTLMRPEGFDCPGCAWPDPKHSASFDICENGAKAIAWEVTDKQVNASFFAENTVQSLLTWGDHELEAAGRLTQPLKYDAVSDCYKPLSWQQAFDEIGARLQSYSDPNQVEFYTSGRTSNEAAFLYQLFAREYGSNNFPDCSNMCHEPTSVGLAASIGVGKGTVLLEDFEKCDLVICIGHNPGTNHPRMLTSLRALVKRGAKMIAINPLQERGLERFTAPQNPFEMLTNSETQLASAYYNVRIGGDMALLKGMMRLLIERDDAASAAGRPSLLDDEFIQTHTVGFDELRRDVLNSEWKDIERISGLSQTQIAELADAYAAAERTIICYGMGITQHEHGTQNVQQLVNLLLMKGNIGKPGAGICPLRGHSNVQGDRTVGITEKPSAEFLARLGERYGFTPPHAPGHAAIASMQAICTGQARALICMGGNFALAMPDREASAVPLTQLDLAVHVATKLNRSHLLTARHSYILPVLGRSEIDMQKNGAQAVTVEDSMSMIHASRGVLKPAGVMLKSECAVVAGIAQAALPQSVVAWEYLVEDYDRIRNDIEAVLPEFADYNQRIRHPGGFHLINAAAERRWMTPSGKANFITSKGLLEDPSSAFNSKLVMATVRSHDQYNTTIYGMDDRYRGVFGQRDVVFMSAKQAKICRVKNGERVNLIALTPDGKRSSRRMDRLKVVIYPMADRSLVTYFPESNHMLTLDNHDPLSGIPGYKSIPVELEPSN